MMSNMVTYILLLSHVVVVVVVAQTEPDTCSNTELKTLNTAFQDKVNVYVPDCLTFLRTLPKLLPTESQAEYCTGDNVCDSFVLALDSFDAYPDCNTGKTNKNVKLILTGHFTGLAAELQRLRDNACTGTLSDTGEGIGPNSPTSATSAKTMSMLVFALVLFL